MVSICRRTAQTYSTLEPRKKKHLTSSLLMRPHLESVAAGHEGGRSDELRRCESGDRSTHAPDAFVNVALQY
mgnify:CR=1 FL=1